MYFPVPVFPGSVVGLSYAPLKFSNEKEFVKATSPQLFDGIP